jgi:hypothetical protein
LLATFIPKALWNGTATCSRARGRGAWGVDADDDPEPEDDGEQGADDEDIGGADIGDDAEVEDTDPRGYDRPNPFGPHPGGFPAEVRADFDRFYGAFVTRHLFDIAEIVAPTVRLVTSGLHSVLFEKDLASAKAKGRRFTREDEAAVAAFEADPDQEAVLDFGGQAVSDPSMYGLLWTFAWLGFYDKGGPLSRREQDRQGVP